MEGRIWIRVRNRALLALTSVFIFGVHSLAAYFLLTRNGPYFIVFASLAGAVALLIPGAIYDLGCRGAGYENQR